MTDSEPKNKILEYARRFKIDICFREDIQIGQKDITIDWSTGTSDFYSIKCLPTLINDDSTVKLESHLMHTKHNSPTL